MWFIAASDPYEVLALSLIRRDSMDAQEIDEILRSHLISILAINLPEDLLIIEVTRTHEPSSLILQLNQQPSTSSCEYANPLRILIASRFILVLSFIEKDVIIQIIGMWVSR